jgi:CDP-glycerol glycerophosphotransferase (TagB/SpsB family)
MKNGVIPKEIAVIGKGFVNGIKIFNPNQKVTYAPAFRFQHLWNGESHSPDKETYTILIALPITFDDSVHIIKQMIVCIDKISIKSLRFWVKPHPTMPTNKLKRKFGSIWPKSFEFIDIDTQTALRKADILVSGMSSICLETIALGVPVLVIDQPRGLQYNPIPNELNQDLSKNCKTSQDILNGIVHYRKRDEEELARHHQLGLKIRETYFEPVTREGVLKFLGIKGDSIIGKS